MLSIKQIFRGAVGWVLSSTSSFFSSTRDTISKFLIKSKDIEVHPTGAFASQHRLPTFDEAVTTHSPGIIQDVKGAFSDLWNIYKIPVDGIYKWLLRPAEVTPETARETSLEFLPIGAAATIGSSVLDGAVEGASGSRAVATGIGKIEALRHMDTKLWGRLGLAAATTLALQSPLRIGLLKNIDYYYNKSYKSQKLELPQSYDAVRFREFLTESEWAGFEGDVDLPKAIEEMSPEEIEAWATRAARAVDAVEQTNTSRFHAALEWLGYKADDIDLQDRAAKHAPSLMMLRQMAMRGFFDAKFMARSIFKGGFDNWAVKPMLNFLAYMAQEGVWVGYREAAQGAFVKGLIDEAELRSILRRIHIPKMLEDPIIETQKLKMSHKDKDLTQAQILNSYIKGVITRQECLIELKGIGYTEALAEILIKTKESVSAPSVRLPTLAQFSRAFREGIITEEDFRAYLDTRGYENKYIDMLLRIEKAKFPVIKPKMTMSSLGRGFREGIISATILKQKLGELGYSIDESNWIQDLYTSQTKIPSVSLSKAEILKAISLKLIDMHEGTERLMTMGYPLEDIEILYRSYHKPAQDIV